MNISLTIAGILCVSILGTLLHFTYRWSGRNPSSALSLLSMNLCGNT